VDYLTVAEVDAVVVVAAIPGGPDVVPSGQSGFHLREELRRPDKVRSGLYHP